MHAVEVIAYYKYDNGLIIPDLAFRAAVLAAPMHDSTEDFHI